MEVMKTENKTQLYNLFNLYLVNENKEKIELLLEGVTARECRESYPEIKNITFTRYAREGTAINGKYVIEQVSDRTKNKNDYLKGCAALLIQ